MEYLTNDTDLTKVADAIRAKGGTSETLVYPDGYVTAINNIQAGARPEVEVNDITFYDYDGTVIEAWSRAEAASKTELPTGPTHSGLVFDGWLWTLDEIKAADGFVDVGALYTTDDGNTRIHINFDKSTWDEFKINFWQSNVNAVTFDWGDGSGTETVAASSWQTVTHAYAASGRYTITMSIAAGKTARLGDGQNGKTAFSALNDTDVHRNSMVEAVELGDMSLTELALYMCTSLRTLSLRAGANVGLWRTFERCGNLRGLVLPANVSGAWNQAFYYCRSLQVLCLPPNIAAMITGGVPFNNSTLSRFRYPNGATTVVNSAFQNCCNLHKVILPDSVTAIGSYAFSSCFSLEDISGLDSVTDIGAYAFEACYSLRKVNGLGSVGNIAAYAFRNCYTVKYYDFSGAAAVPVLANSNAFTGIRSDCEIRVPAALVDEWKAASNWSTYADYIVGV